MIHTPVFNGDGHFCSRCSLSWDQGDPEPPDCLPSEAGYGTQPLTILEDFEIDPSIPMFASKSFISGANMTASISPMRTMVGGTHYLKLTIDPNRFCMRNHLDPCIHGILKYVTRHRDKNGQEDLQKARHYVKIRETYALDLEQPKYEAITMLEYVTQNQICADDAEVLYRLEAYYRAINHTAARICADRLVDEIERLIRKTYLTVDVT